MRRTGSGSMFLMMRVVGVDVAVEAAHLAVGDDVDARALHVADGGVGGVVEHLVEVAGADTRPPRSAFTAVNHQPGLPWEPTTVVGRSRQRCSSTLVPPMIAHGPPRRAVRVAPGVPAKMISPRSIT